MSKPMKHDSPEFRAAAEKRRRTWSMQRYTDLDQMKADEYAYWQSRPGHERLTAVSELATEHYAMKGQHVRRLQSAFVRLQRS